MAARARVERAGMVLVMFVFAAIVWGGAGLQPAYGQPVADMGGGIAAEPAEVETAGAGSPSGTAGLSLLAAAVVATLWNVAVGERRARRAAKV